MPAENQYAAIQDSNTTQLVVLNGSVRSAAAQQKVTDWETSVSGLTGFPDGRDVTELIPATTMTHLMRKYHMPTVDLLKVDIEGAEQLLFSPDAITWLPRVRCLAIKVHPTVLPPGWNQGTLVPLLIGSGLQDMGQHIESRVWCRPGGAKKKETPDRDGMTASGRQRGVRRGAR
ncbi:MAG: hypothetical protein WDW38_000572 [Sanguina aurantia]